MSYSVVQPHRLSLFAATFCNGTFDPFTHLFPLLIKNKRKVVANNPGNIYLPSLSLRTNPASFYNIDGSLLHLRQNDKILGSEEPRHWNVFIARVGYCVPETSTVMFPKFGNVRETFF